MSTPFVDNVVTLSNMYETVSSVLKEVGYEFQAPLDAGEEQEVISARIRDKVMSLEEVQ